MSTAGLIGVQSMVIEEPAGLASDQDTAEYDGLARLLAPGVRLPTTGITLFYGRRNRQLTGHIYAEEWERGHEIRPQRHQVQIRRYTPGKRLLADGIEDGFLTLPNRLTASAMDEINRRWNSLVMADGGLPERFPRKLSARLHLLDELVTQPPFDQLTALSYWVDTICGPVQMITVLDPGALREDPMDPGAPIPRRAVTRRPVVQD